MLDEQEVNNKLQRSMLDEQEVNNKLQRSYLVPVPVLVAL
jgi:hypothetical protein